eukprot:9668242-Heterocapsa_arctica.AAC.1
MWLSGLGIHPKTGLEPNGQCKVNRLLVNAQLESIKPEIKCMSQNPNLAERSQTHDIRHHVEQHVRRDRGERSSIEQNRRRLTAKCRSSNTRRKIV